MTTADEGGRGTVPHGGTTRAWVITLCLAGVPLVLQVPALLALCRALP